MSGLGGPEDPISEMQTITIGNRGIEGAVKAYNDGTDEVKDLLKYECEMIFECRYCRNLFRSIPTFLSHKRQFCKTLCRTVTPSRLISKHLQDFTTLYVNDKNTPPTSVKKGVTRSRHNIVAAFQRKLHTTTISDDMNRVDLYSLPSISRHMPQTVFEDGKQKILRQNPQMARKEHQPDDGALLVMPQDSNVSLKCGDMFLRRRKAADVEEKEMTGKELIVLDYIPTDIRKHINPATCQCLYENCEDKIKPFGSLFALAYHLTLTHNRPLNNKEVTHLRKGRQGQLLCFLCGTTHGGNDKLKAHIQKEHSDIRVLHLQQRRKLFDSQNNKARRKLDPTIYFDRRHRSISPTFSENGKEEEEEEEDSAELPVTESMEIDERSNDSFMSSKSDSQSAAGASQNNIGTKRKFPINKKKKRPRLTMKRKKAQTPSSKATKDETTPTEEQPPKLEKQNIELADKELEEEMEEEMEDEEVEKEPEFEEEKSTTSESQNIPELVSQSTSPARTRSPSNEEGEIQKGLAQTRSKRTRRPKQFFDFIENSLKKGSKQKSGSKEPPKKKSRPSEPEFLTPKLEIHEDMPILHSQQQLEEIEPPPVLSPAKSNVASPRKQKKRNARSSTTSPLKASTSTPLKTATSRLKELKSEFDAEGWITPDSSFNEELESGQPPTITPRKRLPYTPKAAAAAIEGSGRRKQRLNISDDHEGNTPKRLEPSEENEEKTSSKPTDLSLIPIILTPEDEELFFKPLKPLFKEGEDGNHQCRECSQICLSQKEGRRHMLTHVRAVRFRCALCDVGAFYCEDMRVHLMNRHCPSLHLVPDKYQGSAIPCMTTKEADELTQIVHQESPGQYRYTSGKIVTSDNPKPHRPDPAIEESILGSIRVPYISPRKEQRSKVPILSRSNKSPSRLVGNGENNNSTPTKPVTNQNESRIVTPLKLIRNPETIPSTSSSSSSKLKLPGFKLLKPADPQFSNESAETETTNGAEETVPEANLQPSTSAPVEPVRNVNPAPPSPANIEQPPVVAAEAPPPVPELQVEEIEPSDPVPSVPAEIQQPRSLDPVDPSPSY